MKVFILKEGKEYNQGVAYLDDGTMVVVDNARKMISKTIDIVVTSVLQTTAGKMIFGRHIEAGGRRARRRRPTVTMPGTGAAARRAAGAARRRSPTSSERAVVPLVADGLLPDPRDRRSTRSCSARVSIASSLFDRTRAVRPRAAPALWSRLILVTTGVRVACRGPRACSSRARPTSSCRTTRASTTSRSIFWCAAVPAADHRQGVARVVSVPGLAPAPDRPPAGRPPQPGSRRHPATVARAGRRRACRSSSSPKARGARTAASGGSRPAASCWRSRPGCPSCRVDRRHAARDAEGPPHRRARGRDARDSPADRRRRTRRATVDRRREDRWRPTCTPSSAAASRRSSAPGHDEPWVSLTCG